MTAMESGLDLMPGEDVLWEGKPQHHPVFDQGDFLLVPVSLGLFVGALQLELNMIRSAAPALSILLLPFVILCLYLALGRLVARALRSRSTVYAVTNHRVIERIRRPVARTRWVHVGQLTPPVVRMPVGEATGSIAFGQFPWGPESIREMVRLQASWSVWSTIYPAPLVLRDIEHVHHVRDLIASLGVDRHSYVMAVPMERRDTSGFAISSLVFGIFPAFSGVLGILFGALALANIRRSGQKGKGIAIAGMCLGAAWAIGSVAWIFGRVVNGQVP
jgi:hypothetical protein